MQGDLFVRILNISKVGCYTSLVVMVLRALLLRWESRNRREVKEKNECITSKNGL